MKTKNIKIPIPIIVAIAILTPLLTVFITYRFRQPYFLTNDDSGIQSTLSGCLTGSPYPYHQFINIFSGLSFCALYNLFPSITHFFNGQILISIIGAALFNYAILRTSSGRSFNILCFATLCIITFNFLYFFFNILLTSFTISPAILGAGATSFLCIRRKDFDNINEIKKYKTIPFLVSIAIILAFLIRRDTGYCIFCFYCVGIFFIVSNKKQQKKIKTNIRTFLLFIAPLFIFLFVIGKISDITYKKNQW